MIRRVRNIGLGLAALIILMFSPSVWARSGDAGRLLSYGSSGRDVSLGGAVSALSQGSNSLYWNPSLLGEVSRKDFSVLQAQMFGQTTLSWVGYAHPFKKKAGTMGFQLLQLKTQGGDKRDQNNELSGSFSYGEQVLGFGYGFQPTRSQKFSLGTGFNMLQRNLDAYSNTLYGFSVGGSYIFTPKIRSGLVLQNILRGKSGDTDDNLPVIVRLGNAYEILRGFFVTGDMEMSDFRTPIFNFGTEYSWKYLSLRAGRPADGDFAFGVGLNWNWMRLDLAMSSHKDLGSSQVVSLGINFGKDRRMTRKLQSEEYLKQAWDLMDKGRWLEAKDVFDKALKIDPANATIYLRASRLSGALSSMNFSGRKKTALEDEKHFLGSGEPSRLLKDGMKSFSEGAYSDSSLLLRQALAYRKEDRRLQDLVSYVELTGNVKSDVDPGLSPEEVITLKLKKVEDYFGSERYDEAFKVCLELIELAPDMAIARTRLGSIYYAKGDILKARKEYEKALQINPEDESLKQFMKMQGWLQ